MMELFTKLYDIAFNEEPTVRELFTLALSMAVLWCAFFSVGTAIIAPLVENKPWLVAACERDYKSYRKGKEEFGTETTLEEYLKIKMHQWPWSQLVLSQHLIGGMLCVPSIAGWFDEKTAASLACVSIVSEMGWEIQDITTMFYQRFFTVSGKSVVPNVMLIFVPLHHSFTTCLAIPAVLHYRHLRILHWLCFDLQVASAFCMGIVEYTKLLDVTKSRELMQFRWLTFFALILTLWTRVLHFIYLLFNFATVWYADKAWGFLTIGIITGLQFSIFNWFVAIVPCFQRFVKFSQASNAYTSLPESATVATRRNSAVRLSEASVDLADAIGLVDYDEWILYPFPERTLDRRASMPATSRSRRQSHSFLRASMPTPLRSIDKQIN